MDNVNLELMDKEDQEFILALIYLAKEMPKERRAPFLWVGKGLSLAKSGEVYGNVTAS